MVRNPIRSGTEAFHLALGGAGLTGAALTAGVSFGPLAGIVKRLREELDICIMHVIVADDRGHVVRHPGGHAAANAPVVGRS